MYLGLARRVILSEVSFAISPYTAMQNQKAVCAHFTREQILPFGFTEQYRAVRDSNTCSLPHISQRFP